MKKFVSRRIVELALWAVGVSLLGVALATTYERWSYQEEQQRVLFEGESAAVVPAAAVAAPAGAVVAPSEEIRTDRLEPVATSSSRSSATIAKSSTSRRQSPSALARIEIPRVGIRAIVADGADESTLSRAVGRVPNSARPGQIGNTVLAGHRDTFFRGLRDVRLNDRIRIVEPAGTYEYKVQSVMVVDPEDTAVLKSKGAEELTLVTCYPFRFVGPSPDRFIVKAVRVN